MSVKKFFVATSLAFILVHSIRAQDSLKYSTLSLHVGANTVYNKDLFQSPYTYKGTNLLVNSNYSSFRAKGMHIIDLTYSGGQIKSIVSPEANNKLLLFSYDYLFRLAPETKKFMPSLGFGLHTLLSNTNYLPTIESPKSYLSAGAFFTLSGNLIYRINQKSNIRMQVALPLAGVVYRPNFEIDGETLTKVTLPGKSNLFSITLDYNYKLTPKLSVTATYHYNYFTFNKPRPITILQNGLFIGVRKTF